MKKKKRIVIRNEHLNQVRNNFRKIIIAAVELQVEKLTIQLQSIEKNSLGKYRELDGNEKKVVQGLKVQRGKIKRELKKSICKCVQCGRVEGDMKYNLVSDEWHCPDCWMATELEYRRTKALLDSGKPTGEYAFDYYSTFAD